MKYTPYSQAFSFLALLLLLSISAFGQKSEAKFYTGISPYILPKDGIEVNFLNSMTSFWLATNEFDPQSQGSRVSNRYRFTRFQQLLRLTYGFSNSGKWDLGVEGQYTHSRIDDEARSSPFRVLGNDMESGTTFRGLTQLGVRFRMIPFEYVPELTAQLTAHFPINGDEDKRQQLGAERTQVGIATSYYTQFNSSTYCFLQANWNVRLSNEEFDRTTHLPSVSGFLVFDTWEQMFYVFPGLTYSPAMQKVGSGKLVRVNQQLLGSLGGLYQPSERFGLMLNWQVPFILESGSTNTEWVRESFSGVTLGARVVF